MIEILSKTPFKVLLRLLPILVAILVVTYLVISKSGPIRNEESELIRALRVIEIPSVNLVPRAIGYGAAKPAQIWEAVAEVQGTISSIHPRLKSGELIKAGSLLAQINPTEYELALERLEASIEETRAKLKELNEEEENTKSIVAIEQRSMELALKSLERKRGLLKKQSLPQDEVDREERTFLQQKQRVQQLQNTLTLIPSRREALNAALAVQQVDLKQAKIDLAKTTIHAPFNCRLVDVNIEAEQYVHASQPLFKAHGADATEIEARFRPEELRVLLDQHKRKQLGLELGTNAFQHLFSDVRGLVSLQSEYWTVEWEARIDRFRESVDPITREFQVVVAVDHPYKKAIPGERPPLVAGMFCRVELQAPPRPGSVVVPRSAIHDSSVYLIDQEQRLRKQEVVVDFLQWEFVVIQSGLSSGEQLVVSDPSPAIIGMKVKPVTDEELGIYLQTLSQRGTNQDNSHQGSPSREEEVNP